MNAQQNNRGFTVTEIIVAMAVFSFVIIGIIYSHILGLKMFNLTATKLNASQSARASINRMREEIRAGKVFFVGTDNGPNFVHIPNNQPRQGNAIQISATQDTNDYVLYFVDQQDLKLKRRRSGSSSVQVLADSITNGIVFRAEDYLGKVLTNDSNNRIVRMRLEFRQWQFQGPQPPENALYDYYRFQTRMSRRAMQ